LKKVKTYVAMAVTGLMIISFAGCNIIEKTPEAIQKTVLAKVGSEKITKADVDKQLKKNLEDYKTQYGEDFENNATVKEQLKDYRTQIVEALIDEEVLIQSAKDLGVTPTDEEIKAKTDETVNYYKAQAQTEEAYKQMLSDAGYDENSVIEFFNRQTITAMVKAKIVEGLEITDEEIQADYDSKKDSTYMKQPGADVTHLLFTFEKDANGAAVAASEAPALAKAQEARKKVLAGEKISDLATSEAYKAYAIYENLGHLTLDGTSDSGNKMVQEFTDGFKSLPANQISEPIKTSFGYHLILNTAVYAEATVAPLDDTLKGTIKDALLATKQKETYDTKLKELKETLKVKTYEDKI